MSIVLKDWMWDRLPDGMRFRDEESGHLRQLIDLLASGVDWALEDTDRFVGLVDVDNCPAEHLPYLGALLGFEFPYDLSETQQRNFIRSAVRLYRNKGTPLAMKFVITRMIGGGFQIEITDEDHIGKTYTVALHADEDATLLAEMEKKVAYLVALYSPAGMIPTIVIVYFATEEMDSSTRSDTDETVLQHTNWRFNVSGHLLNDNAKANDSGVVELAL